jgi:hypothetical protein
MRLFVTFPREKRSPYLRNAATPANANPRNVAKVENIAVATAGFVRNVVSDRDADSQSRRNVRNVVHAGRLLRQLRQLQNGKWRQPPYMQGKVVAVGAVATARFWQHFPSKLIPDAKR